MKQIKQFSLSQGKNGHKYIVSEVKDGSATFLQYLAKHDLYPGVTIQIKEILPFDGSMVVQLQNKQKITLSKATSENILIKSNE
ncbi:MAG: FeoA family protein [Chryseotalea sp.]